MKVLTDNYDFFMILILLIGFVLAIAIIIDLHLEKRSEKKEFDNKKK